MCHTTGYFYLLLRQGRVFWSYFVLTYLFIYKQLDFQLPQRFNLSYSAEDESKRERPVMIHRAILGSVERMFAILLEHYKGKWPFWLSPRQAIVCPVSDKSQAYGQQVLYSINLLITFLLFIFQTFFLRLWTRFMKLVIMLTLINPIEQSRKRYWFI